MKQPVVDAAHQVVPRRRLLLTDILGFVEQSPESDQSLPARRELLENLATQPGGAVLLYGTGFGPVNPPIPAGRLFDAPNQMTNPVRVRFGDTWVEALGGLAVAAEVAGKQSPAAKIPVRRGEP